ncbi:MAG: dienelactone hydrolase [Sphingomonas sp.]|uniref:Dienelactone hydrolase n=1 Tax=Sphingomonas adhaesiva TaxID=28212 RepID=A0A2A4I965_9SPHN|nr:MULTISPECIES: acyl-CoA thioester hydrolase/BAAT C-terminal domain-containing protein [Sphingomonas]PCG14323.1 dienelactone hydrolase [Sphingomonas adhaesiva]PZU75682.1 MAG: dienelactone hydrolase [Sphingomonas sp.]
MSLLLLRRDVEKELVNQQQVAIRRWHLAAIGANASATRTIATGVTLAACLLASSAAAQQPFRMPPPEVAQPAPGGVRIAHDGLVANWYAASRRAASRPPVVLLLGGSEGGIGAGAARQAADLVAHGFAVLHLAYFGAPGLPSRLNLVPLEYFDRALAWIKRQPGIDPRRISVVGASKGAEAALLVASRHPELHAIVTGAPSAAVWPGIDFTGRDTGSSWTVRGKPLPYLRYGPAATSMFDGYKTGLATLPEHRDAAIPVTRIKAKVLLVCGRADTLWPSCPMAEQVQRAIGPKARVLAYDDAGHAVFGPPVQVSAAAYRSLGSLGGTAEGNNLARADAWPIILAFLTS